MERLVIYDAQQLDCSPFYTLSRGPNHLIIGERAEPLTRDTADETATMAAVFVTSRVDRAALQRLSQLRLLLCLSTGTNHIDLKECAKRGITVCNVPSYGEHTVAEYTFGLMLALTRRLPEAIDRLRHGRGQHADLVGTDLNHKTLTIIGTGRIGLNVIRLAQALGMTILGVDPYPNAEAAASLGFRYVGLHEGLRQADIVSLHAPLTTDNHHLINRHSLGLMKPTAYLINTARGELIDTTALLHALHTQRIAGAGLDVIEGEALLGASLETAVGADGTVTRSVRHELAEHEALLKLPSVILTNHNAFNTREAQARIVEAGLAAARAYLAHQPLPNIVSLKA